MPRFCDSWHDPLSHAGRGLVDPSGRARDQRRHARSARHVSFGLSRCATADGFGGADLYPTVVEKAAAIGFSLMNNHPFVDGNKRVGWAAMRTFLILNGVSIEFEEHDGVQIALAIAAGEVSRAELVQWIIDHVAS